MKDHKRFSFRLSLFVFIISFIDFLVIEKDSSYDYSNDIVPIEKGKLTRGRPHILAEYLTDNPTTSLKSVKKKPLAIGYFCQEGWRKSRLFYLVYCPYCREFIVAYRVGFSGRFDCYICENKIFT